MIGTTDTTWHEQLKHPAPTSGGIDYALDHTNEVLDPSLTRNDIISTYVGLRPLLQPKVLGESKSAKVLREHTVTEVIPGMVTIADGKLTTYRMMAEDAASLVLGQSLAKTRSSVTTQLPLLSVGGFDAVENQTRRLGMKYGFDADRLHHLMRRYGSELPDLFAVIDKDPSLGRPLEAALQFLRAEVHRAYAVEGTSYLEDVLVSRVHLNSEARDHDGAAIDKMVEITAMALDWDGVRLEQEKSSYRERITVELAAEKQPIDATASTAHMVTEDIVG